MKLIFFFFNLNICINFIYLFTLEIFFYSCPGQEGTPLQRQKHIQIKTNIKYTYAKNKL